jgi:hypothetical protein
LRPESWPLPEEKWSGDIDVLSGARPPVPKDPAHGVNAIIEMIEARRRPK